MQDYQNWLKKIVKGPPSKSKVITAKSYAQKKKKITDVKTFDKKKLTFIIDVTQTTLLHILSI